MEAPRRSAHEIALELLADPQRIREFTRQVVRTRTPGVRASGRSAEDIARDLLADPERIRLLAQDVVRERHGRGRSQS